MPDEDFSPADHDAINRIVEILKGSDKLFFITGAGMSADSGLPTYRGVGGLYNAGETEEGMPIEELLSGAMFRRQPDLTWKYLGQILSKCGGVTFHRGHQVLAEMEQHFPHVCILTQNVDGLHHEAGSRNVIEIHGNIRRLLCTRCDSTQVLDKTEELSLPPTCRKCSAILRPDVVLFGEMLAPEAVEKLYDELETIGFDAVFSIGTTSVFPYIAEPMHRAHQLGLPAIEINPDQTQVSHLATVRLRQRAAPALDAIWKRFTEQV
ncbi:MAG: NAD-dependent protein deacylase 2 [Gemmatales bacterium]|nr:MAG: NAD-dependent protein deacylase 2 [Gemmatales bacterium]